MNTTRWMLVGLEQIETELTASELDEAEYRRLEQDYNRVREQVRSVDPDALLAWETR